MFIETPIDGLLLYKPRVFGDNRGHFFESFNSNHFRDRNLNSNFVQDNRSFSTIGSLRGLHLQLGNSAQAKLVSVLRGSVYDVAVDMRLESPTFKKWFGVELNDKEPQSLYIPRGFAHGFVVLSETAEFFYKVDNYYDKSAESGLIYNDPDIAIDWKLPESQLVLSDKDKLLPKLDGLIEQIKAKS